MFALVAKKGLGFVLTWNIWLASQAYAQDVASDKDIHSLVLYDSESAVRSFEKLTSSGSGIVSRVVLAQHTLSPEELVSLSRLPNIEILELGVFPDPSRFSMDGLEIVGTLFRLRSLSVYGEDCEEIRTRAIKGLTGLEELKLAGNGFVFGDEDVSVIGRLDKLHSLSLVGGFQCSNFQWMRALTNLRVLSLGSEGKFDGGKDVFLEANFPKLDVLDVRGIGRFGRDDAEHLARTSPNLRVLILSNVESGVLEVMGSFKQLEVLDLSFHDNVKIDLSSLIKLSSLKSLALEKASVVDDELRSVSGQLTLERMTVRGSELTTNSVNIVRSMPKIHRIQLVGNSNAQFVQAAFENEIAKSRAAK